MPHSDPVQIQAQTLRSIRSIHSFQLSFHQKTVFSGPLLPSVPADYLLHVNDKDLPVYLDDLGRQSIRFQMLEQDADERWFRTTTTKVFGAGFDPLDTSLWQRQMRPIKAAAWRVFFYL